MISHLSGTLFEKSTQSIIITVNGVGYEVFVPLSTFYTLPEKDEPVSLHIHTHVREDALVLFGFSSRLEKSLFLMLVSVSGIGPKLSANILSGMGAQELLRAIAAGDAHGLQAIPGIGKKTAERIALELKDRAAAFSEDTHMQPLKALGSPNRSNDRRCPLGSHKPGLFGQNSQGRHRKVQNACNR